MKATVKLSDIHTSYETDKGTTHSYIETYDVIFGPYQTHNINFLEIGALTCGSLRMFNDFLTKAEIYGIDNWSQTVDHLGRAVDVQSITTDINNNYPRIHLMTCDSTNKEQVSEKLNDLKFKFILDDGDHTPESQFNTFKNFIPYLANNGTYIVESVYGIVELDEMLRTYIKEQNLPYHVKVVGFFKDQRFDDVIIIIR
jgi:cephalosporin hydroxylase